ncbi:MAG: sigma-54-dependent Fis family transcriptional regulator [Deltaproteobacteria bacterium]|jgi:two-component system response regulator AtoC|nr:MAG: sigma-54-dependent Fis family transcriptional regulator [Deltaproteobacteria bacterium]
MAERILVVDDEESLRDVLKRLLSAEGYHVSHAENGKKALALLARERFDYLLCDIRMPVMGGIELLREITSREIPGTVIMMSAFGSVETAVEAMKLGAYDYISKPFMSDEILLTLRKARERESLRRENEALREEVQKAFRPEMLLYASRSMDDVVRMVEKVKDYDTTALVTGESGTGKELVARMLHYGGRRKDRPFVAINCGAIPETLLESELFGHRKGAFTEAKSDRAGLIEEANGGTLFLDEIGELPLTLQTKLLRFLQEGELRRLGDTEVRKVNVRIVAATARDLEQEVSAGSFREDLYYRLNVIRIHVPPLRERREDVPLLAEHFLASFRRKFRKGEMRFSPEAMETLAGHDWRGNVRELENVIERCVLLGGEGEISREQLVSIWEGGAAGERVADRSPRVVIRVPVPLANPDLKNAVKEMERQLIRLALERTGGSRPKAAELLGISHPALLYKAKEYGIN